MSSSLPPRHKKHTGKKHPLRLLLVNCKSVCNKCGHFQNLMDNNNPDVVVVTESWLTTNHPDGEIGETDRFCSKYQIHRRDRVTDTSGGGVFIAVKNDLKSTRCSELKPTDCELMWVKIKAVGEKALYVAAFYRSSVKDTDKLETLRKSVDSVSAHNHMSGWQGTSTCLNWTGLIGPSNRVPDTGRVIKPSLTHWMN